MKVEELMVGDLVKDKGVATRIDNLDFIENSKNLSPIDLTEENLLKSGFIKVQTWIGREISIYRYSKGTDDYYSCVEISPQNKGWFVHAQKFGTSNISYNSEFKGRILFLHELQHILKLIGIEKEVKV